MERPYEKLVAWKEAHQTCLLAYKLTSTFPSHELFGLVSQMRRAASSAPTNLVEGNARRSRKEKAHFFLIARSSLEELHYQAVLARDLQYITSEDFMLFDDQIQRTSFLIHKLSSSIHTSLSSSQSSTSS